MDSTETEPMSDRAGGKVSPCRRSAVAEVLLRWFGSLSTRDVISVMGVAREAGQAVVNVLRTDYGDAMTFDTTRKRYILDANEASDAVLDGCHIDARDGTGALRLLLGDHLFATHLRDQDGRVFGFLPFDDANASMSPMTEEDVVSCLLGAIRDEMACRIRYASLEGDETKERIISPHAVFHASGRYYFQAFDHAASDYRTYHFSRVSEAKTVDEDYVNGRRDAGWHQRADVVAVLNPDLPASARASALAEWRGMMNRGVLRIPNVRKCLVYFIERRVFGSEFKLEGKVVKVWKRPGA